MIPCLRLYQPLRILIRHYALRGGVSLAQLSVSAAGKRQLDGEPKFRWPKIVEGVYPRVVAHWSLFFAQCGDGIEATCAARRYPRCNRADKSERGDR